MVRTLGPDFPARPGGKKKDMDWITKFILVACGILAIAGTKALAHVGYSGRDFGTLMYNSDGSSKTVTIATQTISSDFGWADATDTDWGDSHRGRFFRFTLSEAGNVQIIAQRNDLIQSFDGYERFLYYDTNIPYSSSFSNERICYISIVS